MKHTFIILALAIPLAASCGTQPEQTVREPARPSDRAEDPAGRLAEDRTAANSRPDQSDLRRRIRGPRAGNQGRGTDGHLHRRRVQEARAQTREHGRDLHPEGAAGRHHGQADQAPHCRQGRTKAVVQVERRRGGVDQARRRQRRDQGLRDRVRRLRRGSARVQLGRLQGSRRQGQDDHGARQRSRRARSVGAVEARCQDVQRAGDDLLRPLDLQVRGRGAERRGRRADRSRDRSGGLSLLGRPGQSATRSSTS